ARPCPHRGGLPDCPLAARKSVRPSHRRTTRPVRFAEARNPPAQPRPGNRPWHGAGQLSATPPMPATPAKRIPRKSSAILRGSTWNRGGWRRTCVGFFLLASLASAVSLRVAPRHAKDDFRGAAALAGSALQQNERVWWCADGMGARFYGLPTDNQAARPDAGRAWLIRNPVLTTLSSQPPPDLVVVSKPDLYDAAGGTQEYLARNHYQVWRKLAAFTLWRRAQE